MAVESRLQLQPYDTTVRYYVDGTNGLDGALGTSWATAWKTLAYMRKSVSGILATMAGGIRIMVHLRGSFGASDDLDMLLPAQGGSRISIGCDFADSVIIQIGTVTAVSTASTKDAMLVLDFTGGGITLTAADEGRLIRLDDGAGGHITTYQIMLVDAAANTCRISAVNTIAVIPVWIVGGGSVTANIFESGAVVDGVIRISGGAPMIVEPLDYADNAPVLLFNIRARRGVTIANTTHIALSIDARDSGGTPINVRTEQAIIDGFWRHSYTPLVLSEYGLVDAATQHACFGSRLAVLYAKNSRSFGFVAYAERILPSGCNWTNYCSSAQAFSSTSGITTTQSCVARPSTSTKIPFSAYYGGEHYVYRCSCPVLPAAGFPGGLFQSIGSQMDINDSEGDNTGNGAGCYGVHAKDGGLVQLYDANSVANIKGKHGSFRSTGHGSSIVFAAASTVGARDGSGPDVYCDQGATVELRSGLTKSATNPSGGGTAAPVLVARRGAKVTQAAGSTFTLPAGSGDNTTDYGANGAIDLETLCDVALGLLAGGNAIATNTAVRVKKASRLAHAGAAPTWGAAALDQGGNAATAMPAAVTSDMAAGVPEDCWVLPGSA